jgi:hypothetical protein
VWFKITFQNEPSISKTVFVHEKVVNKSSIKPVNGRGLPKKLYLN